MSREVAYDRIGKELADQYIRGKMKLARWHLHCEAERRKAEEKRSFPIPPCHFRSPKCRCMDRDNSAAVGMKCPCGSECPSYGMEGCRARSGRQNIATIII